MLLKQSYNSEHRFNLFTVIGLIIKKENKKLKRQMI